MDIRELREQIDEIDGELIGLFQRRMDVASQIGQYKAEKGLPVYDPERERQKLFEMTGKTRGDIKTHGAALYSLLFDLSRSYQHRLSREERPVTARIKDALEKTAKVFPDRAVVACQGVEGAYAQLACEKVFRLPSIMYCNSFDSVFAAIDSGLCEYGVLPLENSTAGSINKIYDLMMKYNFSIVRSARLKIDHSLLAKPGTKISDIREVVTHEQAISQCAEYLKNLGVRVTPCENTALAAKLVAQSERGDVAALSSKECAELYGLSCLDTSVQDRGNNYTRFICISKTAEIYPGADKTSIMMALPHRPGSLLKVLSRFYALGINLIKLESRPMPDRDFEFMFYFDLETSVYSPEFIQIISELDAECQVFRYLGSYQEIV